MSEIAVREGAARVMAIGVVIPVFRHSVLLVEAIESALAQDAVQVPLIVIVNDGCPHRETEAVCRAYAMAWPDRIRYVRKPNGGLSDARNVGIRHVLDAAPEVGAIYMLDADNRLRPGALARAAAELEAHPEADWIYPNIDMFGLTWAGDYGGEFSLLLHSRMNLCEAGSLIRRRVFEAGVFFDTDFQSGFEDWEFFLRAAEKGFLGRNLESFGFQYRKRGESMLAESEREAAVIRGEIERKHRGLYRPRRLVDLEQGEAPRFAVLLADRNEVLLTLDPAHGAVARLDVGEFERMWWLGQMRTTRHHLPPFLVVTRAAVWEALQATGLLHGMLWLLERRATDEAVAGLIVEAGEAERLAVVEERGAASGRLRADMVMASPALLRKLVWQMAGVGGEAVSAEEESLTSIRVRMAPERLAEAGLAGITGALRRFLPSAAVPVPWSAGKAFGAIAARLARSDYRAAAGHKWEWRHPDIGWRSRSHEVARVPTGAKAAFPRASDGRFHIGFVMPMVEFGGVERVALNIAAALKAAGMVPHLFVLEARNILFSAEWQEVFESVTFLGDPDFATWGPGQTLYQGTVVSDWARWGDHGDALGMMAWLDAALNFHGGAISGVMGQLRRFGVRTGLSLHLNDLSGFGRPVGNAYLGLAFEHAYDMVLPCSHQLGEWCHAMGIPEEKVVPVPNAPSFALPGGVMRRPRAAGAPLRVIYLGRLDAQKGLDRLTATLRRAKAEGISLRWRLIGKAVTDGGAALPEDIAAMLAPPILQGHMIAAALAEADVFFLPSYYEGLPLTVLEAMRSGVVPVATNVGAVREVLRDGENGALLDGADVVGQAVAALQRLAGDDALLARLSAQAMADMAGRDWAQAVQPLVERLRAGVSG